MIWDSWSSLWAMGGYGGYVWGSFGAAALLVAGELVGLRLRRATALAALRRGRPA